MGLPEVFYGNNNLIITHKNSNIILRFCAVDSLSYSGFDKRRVFLRTDGPNFASGVPANSDGAQTETLLQLASMQPNEQ